ncbi:hypothetical protein K470DRAFT_171037 [Piedraia hortae CBS 480.64]|uniref:Uncharacterized protein n=1 Tax=Piedraia hortae CBS 480.64 TaxID=1314780 RepID=A0A6A7BRZ3_9PEZI|nr:hypothetical protein K470DRAFT_171037 [Piedraia hortae CBS 480.64]
MTIMQRLPATSREGFPSLPYLIDQARAFADLVQLWVEVTTGTDEASVARAKQIVADVEAAGGPLLAFHETCLQLHRRTQDCLNRAERAERPPSAGSFQWEHMIDQLRMVEDYPERAPSTSPQRPVTRGIYDREAGHRERREAAKIKIQQQLQARSREHEHEKRRKMPLAALRKGKNSRKETTE